MSACILSVSTKIAVSWLIFGVATAVAVPAQAVERDLYLIALAGQSNMSGAGDVNALPVGFPKNGPRIWNFSNANTWELAKEPVHSNDEHPGVGPALAMADAFTTKYPHVSVGLIPCAKSGSGIAQWQPNLSQSSLYGSCLYRQKQAAQQGKLRALVFWQGGGDGKDKKRAESWGENFKRMVMAWRTDIGDPKLPVILLVVTPAEQTLRKYPYRDVVRQQQLSVQMPYLTKIETIGYDHYSDGIHLTTLGQLALGPVIATALASP
jgi:hypothetical protein